MAQINKPTDYFNTVLYTGDGTSPRTITGVGFDPDFVWGRRRDDAAGHNLFDRVRGAGSTKNLQTNGTGAEGSGLPATYGYISAFATDGFTVTQGSTDNTYWNNNTATYVAWNWLAGGTASSNTDGNLTSQVSANTTSGFSIVSWTGDGTNNTVGHGLGQTPSIVIAKNRSNTSNWDIITNIIDGSIDYLKLNLTDAKSDLTGYTLNSSVFSLNYPNGDNIITYCFAEKKGFSKFGSYTGNGSADGPFVYTGFKPSWVLVRNVTDASAMQWVIHDNKRSTFNVTNKELRPDSTEAEVTQDRFDFLSNGFKVRNSSSYVNRSGETIIYMAFAESPLVGTNNIPATAR